MLMKGDELMSKIRTILALCLCIFIAILSIGYITIGMNDKEEETTPSATDSSADFTTAPVTVETPSETVSESNTAETTAQPKLRLWEMNMNLLIPASIRL